MTTTTDNYDPISMVDTSEKIMIFGASTGHKTITCTSSSETKLLIIVHDAQVTVDISQLEGSTTMINAIVISSGAPTRLSLTSTLCASNTHTTITIVTFCTPHSDCSVDGSIVMNPNIVGASGHLLEKNLLLGGSLKLRSLPVLDVRSNDISASHGATVDRLDPVQMFYCMARGLDKNQSTQLMIDSMIRTMTSHIQSDTMIIPLQTMISNYILSLMGISGPQLHAPSNRSHRVSHHLHSIPQKP